MMEREEKASMWQRLKYSFSDNGGRSNAVTRVEQEDDGTVVEYMEQEDMEQVVCEITQRRFTMADSSPFCNELLGEQLGYIADTKIAQSILDGTFQPPPNTPDSIVLVLEEIVRIAKEIGEGAVQLVLTAEEFQQCWHPIDERTASSRSKIHFGH
jgi:hypothetical protein